MSRCVGYTLLFLVLCLSIPARAEDVPFVNGYIGNRSVRFMVDTGASEVSIPYRRAIELGIPVFNGQRSESTTASGRVGIYKIRLAAITVGDVTVRNVAAHVSISEGGSQEILLGMSFLRYVSLHMHNGTVTIGP
jgi:aspartyl protease family protein